MSLKNALEQSFQTYAGMTIRDRAICDARDCLKPGARMSMYAQFIEKITPDKPYRKSQKSVAAAMDHFYVHGDLSLYPLFARLGKTWAMRYVLEDFQGNTGTIEESNNEAASRYTEMRLAPLAMNLFTNIEKETITKWNESYSGEENYPTVLPSVGFYNIVNGTSGIATAISASIPQFNLKEVNEAMIKLLYNKDVPFDEIYCAPDFCTGAILLNEEEVKESLRVGYGSACKLRSVLEYDNVNRCIIVKEIPYGVYTETIRGQLMEIMESENNPGIEKFLDQSGTTPVIKIFISKRANPDKIIRYLYKNTALQYHYAINMIMLDNGKVPKVFGWREALQAHIDHEIEIYTKSYQFDLRKIAARIHIVDGLLVALANIDEVISIIKNASSSTTAGVALREKFLLDEIQTKHILDTKLSRLAKLEVKKLQDEKQKLDNEASRLKAILNDDNLLKAEIEKGFRATITKFGDARRTKIMNISKNEEEEPVEVRQLILNFTNIGSIFVTEGSTLYTQRKGGVGTKFKLEKGEYVVSNRVGDNTDMVLFFSNKGNFYHVRMSELPVGEKIHISSLINVAPNESICATTILAKNCHEKYILFVTKNGMFKKSALTEYNVTRAGGARAIELNNGDEISSVLFVDTEAIGVLSSTGNLLLTETVDIRSIGRIAKGIKGMKLDEGDYVVSAHTIPNKTRELVSISRKGLSKRTDFDEFTFTGKNTKGKKIQKIVDKDLIADFLPIENEQEIIVVSSRAQLKTNLNEISLLGRGAQGSKTIKLNITDKVISLLKI